MRLDDALQFEPLRPRQRLLRLLGRKEPGASSLRPSCDRPTRSPRRLVGLARPQHLARGGREYQEPCFVLGALLGWWRDDAEVDLARALAERWRRRAEVLPHPARSRLTPTSRGSFRSSLQAQVIQAALGDQAVDFLDRRPSDGA